MASRITRLAIPATLVAGAAFAVSFGAGPAAAGNPCFHSYEVPPASEATASRVSTNACDFAPTVTYVEPGTTVTFVNDGPFSHLITGANGEWGSREVELAAGANVSYRFDRPGIYPYACSIHPGMAGAIVVGDVATSTAASEPSGPQPGEPSNSGTVAAGVGLLGLLLGGAGLWFATRRRSE